MFRNKILSKISGPGFDMKRASREYNVKKKKIDLPRVINCTDELNGTFKLLVYCVIV